MTIIQKSQEGYIFQINSIISDRNDIKNGQIFSHDKLQNEINQWLEERQFESG